MQNRLPLPALLSHALVAYTIEFDNEAEHRLPHRTTAQCASSESGSGPWLTSMVMYLNCLKFIGPEGVRVGELERLARTPTNLNGMVRWRYITIGENLHDVSARRYRADELIRTTPAGRASRAALPALFGVIESRWKERFDSLAIAELRNLLERIVVQIDPNLPDCMPILGPGLVARSTEETKKRSPATEQKSSPDAPPGKLQPWPVELPIVSLLAKVLLAFTKEFENESHFSIAINADVLRVVSDEGVPLKDLPHMSSVSKEAIAMALSFLSKRGLAVIETVTPERAKTKTKWIRLTTKGRSVRDQYPQRVEAIERRWRERFGHELVDDLEQSLARIVGDGSADNSPLFEGLEPYPENWRARRPKPQGLPHYPMVLHRGGFPDGS